MGAAVYVCLEPNGPLLDQHRQDLDALAGDQDFALGKIVGELTRVP